MKHRFLLGACLIALSAPVLAQDAAAEAALKAIRDLGTLNGQALACSETEVASRAKKLMLAHAPKTQAYGDAYQNATLPPPSTVMARCWRRASSRARSTASVN